MHFSHMIDGSLIDSILGWFSFASVLLIVGYMFFIWITKG
jgi:hypothetical protein